MGRFRRQPKWSPLTGTPGGMAGVRHGPRTVEATARFAGRLAGALDTPGLGAAGLGIRGASSAPDPAGGEGRAAASRHTWHEPEATNAVVAQLASSKTGRGTEAVILDTGALTFVVSVDGARCTMCGSCALPCPSTSLTIDPAIRTLAVDSSRCVGCCRCVTTCPEAALSVERGPDTDSVLAGPTPVEAASHLGVCPECGSTTDVDPLVASVQRRLAARGRSAALLASLSHQRCPACSETVRCDGRPW